MTNIVADVTIITNATKEDEAMGRIMKIIEQTEIDIAMAEERVTGGIIEAVKSITAGIEKLFEAIAWAEGGEFDMALRITGNDGMNGGGAGCVSNA